MAIFQHLDVNIKDYFETFCKTILAINQRLDVNIKDRFEMFCKNRIDYNPALGCVHKGLQ